MTIRETVLLVDDEPAIRAIARRTLERLGYDVLDAAGGREAIGLFADHARKIDVVLLDMNMPDVSGLEAFSMIRRMKPDLPVVFVTGYADSAGVDELLDCGAEAVLTKPFELQQLAAVVRATIDGNRALNSWVRRVEPPVMSL